MTHAVVRGTLVAVTLRAIARRIAIAAPSIYAHFPDLDAILAALVEDGFRDLRSGIHAVGAGIDDPLQKLRATCRAYCEFAARRPQRYRLMFGTRGQELEPSGFDTAAEAKVFGVLVNAIRDCLAAGGSETAHAFFGATTVWIALHGYATLRPVRPYFPRTDDQRLIDHLLTALPLPPAKLSAPWPDA